VNGLRPTDKKNMLIKQICCRHGWAWLTGKECFATHRPNYFVERRIGSKAGMLHQVQKAIMTHRVVLCMIPTHTAADIRMPASFTRRMVVCGASRSIRFSRSQRRARKQRPWTAGSDQHRAVIYDNELPRVQHRPGCHVTTGRKLLDILRNTMLKAAHAPLSE
jgi:hypothetical protein